MVLDRGYIVSFSKFGNKKTVVDGHTFDSQMEAARYQELLLLQRAGQIHDLRLQVRFELLPAIQYQGAKRKTTGVDFVADFVYEERISPFHDWVQVIEDCKGARTAIYKLKKHMMKALLGLEVFETKPRR